jgi:hypothetical protein
MTPREALRDRIARLGELAESERPDGDQVNELLSGIRVYFAAIGATHRPRPPHEGVSAGTLEQARSLYR